MNTQQYAVPVSQASSEERATFIRRTYSHLAGALLAFAGIEAVLVNAPFAQNMAMSLLGSWWIVLIAFVAVGWVANKWALSDSASSGKQYLGLALYTVLEAIICMPLIWLAANRFPGEPIILQAGIMTGLLVAGITYTAFATRKDFSFLGPILAIGLMVAFGVIICGMIFGFQLGLFFCAAMVLLCGGCILYTTSNIIHRYNTNQHVAASLSLFASIATMFYYILMMLMSRD